MTDPNVQQKLIEFLEWEERKRLEGKTIDALLDKQDRIMIAVRRIAKDRLADKAKLETHGRAIKTLQSQVALLTESAPTVNDWRAPKEEITGTHSLKEIARAQQDLEDRMEEEEDRKREEEERKRDDATWWKRQGWIWAFAVGTLLVGGMVSSCASYVMHRIEISTPTPH